MADRRVLIVDDEELIRQLARHIVELEGLAALEASGRQELEELYDAELDAIVLDMKMPGTDGIELLRMLAGWGCTAGIILVSGVDSRILDAAGHLGESQGLRIVGVLQKPFHLRDFRAMLREAVEPAAAGAPEESHAVTVEGLEQALRNDEIRLHYQPKIDLRTGALHGVEALARWRHPERGMVSAGRLVQLAEDLGHADAFTERVFRIALRQAAAWQAEDVDIQVAVNVPTLALQRLDLPEHLEGMAADVGVALGSLMIELTESGILRDDLAPLDILTRLRLKGISLAIDDFGTGWSSLQRLERFPFTELKVDQSFVQRAAHHPDARIILDSTMELAQRLQLRVVAEGVETEEQLALVRELGCDLVQGYLIAMPMPGDELPGWHREWKQRGLPGQLEGTTG